MRRKAVLVVAVVLIGVAWVALKPESNPDDQDWAVKFALQVGLSGRDVCDTSPLITGGMATGPSSYGGFWTFATQADAEQVAACYERAGGSADAHKTTDEERDRLAYEKRLKEDACLNAEDHDECERLIAQG